MDQMLVQAVTLSIATVGAVLGLLNTWHTLETSRVKLKVMPAHAIPFGGMDESIRFCIQVTNMSAFAVTINEVGLLLHGSDKRAAITTPILIDGGSWPRRLEARSSVTAYARRPEHTPSSRIRCAYARTDCGTMKKGNSKALKQISKGEQGNN